MQFQDQGTGFFLLPGNFSGPNIHPDNLRLAVLPINDSCCFAETLLKHTWSMITITHLKVSKVWLGRLQCLKKTTFAISSTT